MDERTGLPIHSLYGETRTPTAEMLEGVEVLLFDIQDVGARYYTYLSTMALAMGAAGEHGIPFVVLDRPNPIGGDPVQGNVLDPGFASFVGLYPIPMRHGLTAGEFARMAVGEFGVRVELRVAIADGWRRTMPYVETGIPWIAPSPNMPSVESALHYPGTCLFEGTPISVGRGTDRAFQQVGAPWLDGEELPAVWARSGYRMRASCPCASRPGSPATASSAPPRWGVSASWPTAPRTTLPSQRWHCWPRSELCQESTGAGVPATSTGSRVPTLCAPPSTPALPMGSWRKAGVRASANTLHCAVYICYISFP